MEIGLFHSVQWPHGTTQHDRYQEAIEQVCLVEQHGFDSVWFTEHHFNRHGIVSDSLAMLSYVAARTSSVRLGTAVSVLPLHNPMRLAETAALVDQLSGGRLELGIGRGFQVGEFSGFGLDIHEKSQRFEEAIEVLMRAWTEDDPFTHKGYFYRFEDAAPQPRPLQRPHPPIWVATDTVDGLQSCVRNGFGVLLQQGSSLAKVEEQLARYRTALASDGKQLSDGKLYLSRAMYVAPTDDEARAIAEPAYEGFSALAKKLISGVRHTIKDQAPTTIAESAQLEGNLKPFGSDSEIRESALFGSPDSVIEYMQRLRSMGVTRLMLFVNMGQLPHEKIMASLDLFCREVLPVAHDL
jgi:alkanesulfonate monooxygenase SsuD/methylene tetrahydromethanopterin reductase-like flavin-dependent oxidoreductase (luciferase family)